MATALMVATLGMAMGTTAEAQQRDPQRDPARPRMERQTFTRPQGVMDSRQLIGTKVKGADGKDLGEIDMLLIDRDGKVTHAVIGIGGMLGVGESHVALPWSEVRVSPDPNDRDRMVARVDQATLDRAPRFERRAAAERDRVPATSPRTEPAREPAPRDSTDRK
jgi:hypothetical protein